MSARAPADMSRQPPSDQSPSQCAFTFAAIVVRKFAQPRCSIISAREALARAIALSTAARPFMRLEGEFAAFQTTAKHSSVPLKSTDHDCPVGTSDSVYVNSLRPWGPREARRLRDAYRVTPTADSGSPV